MFKFRILLWISALLLTFILHISLIAEVAVDPHGIAVAVDPDETTASELTIANLGEEEISFSLRISPRELDEERDGTGPVRDERIGAHLL